ncbi:oxysterol-binding protein-related protein 8 isoform X1 [Pieris napi]|uniref:oxysterol-binding protein-related protein 8 isoform X1 n=1 Tax=Pieris napi TaxID=78633 RepID=UPI001FBA3845|nr:oxysterol-binding protein-related protein 8 isoform X1 [Pieris napi]
MSSSPAVESSTPAPSSPAVRLPDYPHFQTSTPNYLKKTHQPLNVVLSSSAPSSPPVYGEPTLTPPPRSPGAPLSTPASGDRAQPPDGTSSDKSSETAVGVSRNSSTALSRKESYKAQRQHYRKEKKRAATALLHSIEDPSVVVLADWLKVRGSLKSWTKLWCVLKPGLLLLYKSPKAKRSHWVGTVLLTSCQVIERPSKKDGFCFKLYHPLEQSIWAPRGPHNETIGAVVQPLPTAHLIFRAPSQAAGHCWLDGLELALRCSNAMLRCSRSRPEQTVEADAPSTQTNISHEELEKHFNEHGFRLDSSISTPTKPLKRSSSSDNIKTLNVKQIRHRSLTSSPMALEMFKRSPILKLFDMPKIKLRESFEEKYNRRSSTPSIRKSRVKKRTLRESGVKTDSEDDGNKVKMRFFGESEVICNTPENILITKTAPSNERFRDTTTSSSDDVPSNCSRRTTPYKKYSLIDYTKLPSASFEASQTGKRDDRISQNSVYIAGKIVANELAGAASDTDSEASRQGMPVVSLSADPLARKREVLSRIESLYVEDPDREIGVAGELVEEVAEENKSLLWFLLKQVRPGMDLSKVVLPTFILEPRSFLDKLSDNYYHADLLGQAQILEDPYQRFKGVLRWYLSGLYRKPKGLKKPYNPVLGETFRCCWRHKNDTYTYYIAEQVSHHPPVSAFYISNRKDGFVIEGSLLARSKFYGNSTSAILEGCARIHLLNWGETYITTAPYAHCKGIVIGTLSMELGGKVHIICQETGYQADVEFKLRSFLGGADQTNAISGRIKRGKDTIATVEGYWDGRIDIKDKKTGDETSLLDVSVLKEQRLPRYLVDIEKQHEWESQRLWVKVSEAILSEDQVLATEQKTIIEEAQRARARNQLTTWTPRLFHSDTRAVPPEGIIDQGWKYNHTDTSPWQPEEIIEYEDDFIITSIKTGASMGTSNEARLRELSHRASDSESHDDLARRSKTSTRTLKQTLHSIDSTLREQSIAIERLTKSVEMLNEGQRAAAFHPQNVARIPTASHSWDLFGGFVLAMVLQALLNWIFHQREQRD